MDYKIVCKHCGKSALRGKSFAQWCSDECKWAARRARDKRPDEGPGLKLWANENPCITPDPDGAGGAFVVAHSAEDAAEAWNECDYRQPHAPLTTGHDWREQTAGIGHGDKCETPADICERNGRGFHCFRQLDEGQNPVPEVGSVWLAMMRKKWCPRKVLSVVFAGDDAVITLGAAKNEGSLNTCARYRCTFWDKTKFKPADAEETEPEAKAEAEAEQEASAGGVAEELAALRAEVAALRADIAAAESRRSADSASVGALLGELAKAWK